MLVIVNRFTIPSSADEAFERIFAGVADHLADQPGFLGHRLVRSLRDPDVYINIAEWSTPDSFEHAIGTEGFRAHVRELREVTTGDLHRCAPVLEHRMPRPE